MASSYSLLVISDITWCFSITADTNILLHSVFYYPLISGMIYCSGTCRKTFRLILHYSPFSSLPLPTWKDSALTSQFKDQSANDIDLLLSFICHTLPLPDVCVPPCETCFLTLCLFLLMFSLCHFSQFFSLILRLEYLHHSSFTSLTFPQKHLNVPSG